MRAKLGEGRLYGGRYGSRETRALNFDQTMGQRERERERRSGREMTSSSPKWIPIFSFHSFNLIQMLSTTPTPATMMHAYYIVEVD